MKRLSLIAISATLLSCVAVLSQEPSAETGAGEEAKVEPKETPAPKPTPEPDATKPAAVASEDQYPPVTAEAAPVDYHRDKSRGRIALLPGWRNYSWHTVELGNCDVEMTLEDMNFSQELTETVVFWSAGEPCKTMAGTTFQRCNLHNVWLPNGPKVIECNTVQADVVPEEEEP